MTEYAECIEHGKKSWKLHPACRVRKEDFGLLFYDLRGPKLLFAETGSTLAPHFFTALADQQQQFEQMETQEYQKIKRFLDQLVKKGFLYEQPIC